MKFIYFIFTNILHFVHSQQYILTPKTDLFDVSVYSSITKTYQLNKLAEFDGFSFYISNHTNLLSNRVFLSELFDIEEDVRLSLNVNKHDFKSVVNKMYDDNEYEVPWHLSRVVQKSLPLKNQFPYLKPGSCHKNNNTVIHTYVVDTGIDVKHPLFQGRASWSANFADTVDTDCNNHGTHVAGLIGSHGYGVCSDAKLFAVKVLDCEGSGSLSGVIQGIEWVYNKHKGQTTEFLATKNKKLKSVINMSLGGGFSSALNKAVELCVKKENDFYIVVAAGNENSDSCKSSPASVKNIMTVMASDSSDNRAWFSNWGLCSNIYAPGVDVLSTIPDNGLAKYSGTSMASPVMTGVLNHFLDMYSEKNMTEILKLVASKSSKNTIKGDKPKTPNLLVYLNRE